MILLYRSVRQSFHDILPPGYAHDRYSRDLSDPSLQISIIRSHDIDFMFHDSIDDAIIGVDARVIASQTLPALIPRDA